MNMSLGIVLIATALVMGSGLILMAWPGIVSWWLGLFMILGAWALSMVLTVRSLWFGFSVIVISVYLVGWIIYGVVSGARADQRSH